jgi:hypothetical protein
MARFLASFAILASFLRNIRREMGKREQLNVHPLLPVLLKKVVREIVFCNQIRKNPTLMSVFVHRALQGTALSIL